MRIFKQEKGVPLTAKLLVDRPLLIAAYMKE
jgi:hypothetical protein